MKELSINEKAKAYDKAKINGSRLCECGEITRENYEYIFPELKESWDERIRKAIIDFFKDAKQGLELQERDNNQWQIEKFEIFISWLEKQGEHANFRNKIQIGDKVTRNEDGVLVNLSQFERVVKKAEKQEQKSVEWSEEDERMLNDIINDAEQDVYLTLEQIDFLKSLRPPYYCDTCKLKKSIQSWKPSDEQIKALRESIGIVGELTSRDGLLKELVEQLNKLK